jgi:hypothetical protein
VSSELSTLKFSSCAGMLLVRLVSFNSTFCKSTQNYSPLFVDQASSFPRIFGHEAAGYGLLTFPLYQILCCNFFAIFLLT